MVEALGLRFKPYILSSRGGGQGFSFGVRGLEFGVGLGVHGLELVAEWIHFTLFGIILPTMKLKVHTFGGL